MSESPLTAGQEIRVLSVDRALQLYSSYTYGQNSGGSTDTATEQIIASASKIEEFIKGQSPNKSAKPPQAESEFGSLANA